MEWVDQSWEDRAACSGHPSGTQFHHGQEGYDEMVCKAICATCPVQMECLHAAMTYEAAYRGVYRFGVWGGLSAAERGRLSLEDDRYAVYPEGFSEIEVQTIFREITSAMNIQFRHPVDGFLRGEVVDANDEIANGYISGGHASKVTAKEAKSAAAEAEASAPKLPAEPAKKAAAKKA